MDNSRKICICNHAEVYHYGFIPGTECTVTFIVETSKSKALYRCSCKEFKLDNLKYLEEKYESQTR